MILCRTPIVVIRLYTSPVVRDEGFRNCLSTTTAKKELCKKRLKRASRIVRGVIINRTTCRSDPASTGGRWGMVGSVMLNTSIERYK